MGKSTGFIEYMRELPPDRPPLERVKDWNESHPRVPDEVLMRQGARCMDCGTPYCHTGKLMGRLLAAWAAMGFRSPKAPGPPA